MAQNEFRKESVQFLFALALTQVAIFLIASLKAGIINNEIFGSLAAISHSILSLVVLQASWFGWRASVSVESRSDVSGVFSRAFALSLIDLLLVFLYLWLAREAEVTNAGLFKGKESPSLLPPSAVPESLLIVTIFLVYAIWDFVSKYNKPKLTREQAVQIRNTGIPIDHWKSPWPSITCVLIGFMIFFVSLAIESKENIPSPIQIIFFNISLICVVLFFRTAKQYQTDLIIDDAVDADNGIVSAALQRKPPAMFWALCAGFVLLPVACLVLGTLLR